MLKKTVTYEDFNGVTRTEDFYFNLTKEEILNLQNSVSGGYGEYIQGISNAEDAQAVYEQVKKIIDISYGEKSEDGRSFNKSDDILNAFKSTNAYSNLIFDMLDQENALVDFVNGILPQDLLARATETLERHGGNVEAAKLELEQE